MVILFIGGTIFQFKSYDEMLLAKICNGRTFESKYQNGNIVVVTTQTQARTNTINDRDEEQESLRLSTQSNQEGVTPSMAFCTQCGAKNTGAFCKSCGLKMNPEQKSNEQATKGGFFTNFLKKN